MRHTKPLIGLSLVFLLNSYACALSPSDIAVISKLISDANQDSKPRPKASTGEKNEPQPIQPIQAGLSPQLVEFPYHKDFIYPIKSKPGRFTNIELSDGEEIIGWFPTDRTNWVSRRATESDADLFIKPIRPDVEDMPAKLVTNKRKYQLLFKATAQDDWYQRVSWTAPEDTFYEKPRHGQRQRPTMGASVQDDLVVSETPEVGAAQAQPPIPSPKVRPEDLNLNYKIEGEAYFKPLMVFDDGKWTWLKFPKDMQIAPPLFELDSNGGATILEYQPRNGMYFVQQILPYGALLKLNKEEVRIYNLKNGCGGLFQNKCAVPALLGGNQ